MNVRGSLRLVKKSISRTFRSRSRGRTPAAEAEAEDETTADQAIGTNIIDRENCTHLDAADVVAAVEAAVEDIVKIAAENDAGSGNQLDDCIVEEGELA